MTNNVSEGRDPLWDALKKHKRQKFDEDRDRFMQEAITSDDGGWTRHSQWHWSRTLIDSKLDYWPSRKKFQYKGKIMRGDVYKYITKRLKDAVHSK